MMCLHAWILLDIRQYSKQVTSHQIPELSACLLYMPPFLDRSTRFAKIASPFWNLTIWYSQNLIEQPCWVDWTLQSSTNCRLASSLRECLFLNEQTEVPWQIQFNAQQTFISSSWNNALVLNNRYCWCNEAECPRKCFPTAKTNDWTTDGKCKPEYERKNYILC